MSLRTSLTGSYPPVFSPDGFVEDLQLQERDPRIYASIERAIHDQIQLGIDVLVDGQGRDDIVSLFARKMPGYSGRALRFRVIGSIHPPSEPITVSDYLYAKGLAGTRPLKAHVTGPMTMTRSTIVEPGSGYTSRNDPRLVMDLATALGQEARWLVQNGAEIVQIDEPVLRGKIDRELAFQAMKKIVEIGEIPFPALHICGDVTHILEQTLKQAPVKMISIKGDCLTHDRLLHVDRSYLRSCGKQIGLGSIKVDEYTVEPISQVQDFLDRMVTRLGEEGIWAVMPNCGLRPVPYEVARKKLEVMVEAAHKSL